jgi:tight adherence protein B
MSLSLIALATFVLVASVLFFIGWSFENRRAPARLLRRRLEDVRRPADQSEAESLELLRDETLSQIPALDKLLRRSDHITRLQQYLSQAQIQVRAGRFLLISALLFAVSGMLVASATRAWYFGVLAALFCGGIPFLLASYRRKKRFRQFEEDFPEAIDLLARAVRAGHAFTTALELIATEVADPVGGEFRKLFEEQKFGLPMRDALANLVSRVPIIDVKFFVTALMLQRETGGNLAELLDKLSYLIRERFKIHRQVRVYTAQGRLTMMILMGLPPLVVVVMWLTNPHFIRILFVDPLGKLMILTGIILQSIGFMIIRRIIRIEV